MLGWGPRPGAGAPGTRQENKPKPARATAGSLRLTLIAKAIAGFAGSMVCWWLDPGAYAPGFMLSSAPRAHPVPPGTDPITCSFDRTKTAPAYPLSSWLRFRIDVGAPANINAC